MKISRLNLRFRLYWQHFRGKFLRRKFRSIDTLDADALRKIQAEVEILKGVHSVQVESLKKGEKPELPKPVESVGSHSTFHP